MGDLGNAVSGASSAGSSVGDVNSLFSDASLGDALTGGSGDIFGASSSTDLSNLFADAGLGSSILGDASGLGGAFNTATDPSGAGAAALSTTPPTDAAGTPQGSDPSGNVGGTQSGGAPQPNAPQSQQPTQKQQQPASPLGQLAKLVQGAFGLGSKPTSGGPTGFTPQNNQAPQSAQRALANLLPTMPTPAETGELPPGGYAVPPGRGGIGSDAGAAASQTDDPAAKAAAEGGVATPQPSIPIGGGPGMAMEAPTGTPAAAQPPAVAAKPAPAPAAAPAAPAAAPAATPDLPTRKEPAAPEAAPGPPEGQGGSTDGIGGILRDVLGLTLSNPTLLPMLAQLMMGGRGRGRGGIPPWAMHGMMPFMRGRGRGFGGFRGGFLRPGYYPRRQGGWGFHPGGYHPGWGAWAPGAGGNQPMPFAGGGGSSGGGGASGGWQGANTQSGGIPNSDAGDAGSTDANGRASSSNPFISKLLGLESGGQNIVSRTDKDDAGRTLAQGGNPDQISQGYFQIRPSTWRTYAKQAGVDPNILPRNASYADQWKVASVIPFAQWGPRTKQALGLGNIDSRTTLGQVASRYGGTQLAGGGSAAPSSTTILQPGFRVLDPNPDPLTSHAYPAPTETGGAPPVQSDDFASAG